MPDIVSTSALAERAGVVRQRVQQWKDEGMPGRVGYGKWDAEVALPWIAERRGEDAAEGNGDTASARTKHYIAQTKLIEVRTRKLEGQLVETAAIGREFASWAAEVREAAEREIATFRSAEEQAIARRIGDRILSACESATRARAHLFDGGEHLPATGAQQSRSVG